MLALCHHPQVARIVIVLVPVDVMDDLATEEATPEHSFGDDTVLMSAALFDVTHGSGAALLSCALGGQRRR